MKPTQYRGFTLSKKSSGFVKVEGFAGTHFNTAQAKVWIDRYLAQTGGSTDA